MQISAIEVAIAVSRILVGNVHAVHCNLYAILDLLPVG